MIRLAKKNDQAVLSFEITGSSRNGRRIRVVQDVRIEVMRPQDVERLAEPMCPEPDVRRLLCLCAVFTLVFFRSISFYLHLRNSVQSSTAWKPNQISSVYAQIRPVDWSYVWALTASRPTFVGQDSAILRWVNIPLRSLVNHAFN